MKDILTAFVFVVGIAMVCTGGVYLFQHLSEPQAPVHGSSSDNAYNNASPSLVQVGKDVSTTLVSTSTGRQYLEIINLSGATSSPQTLYCNVNGAPASTPYLGFTVAASSSRVFNLDNLYRSALNCKFHSATGTVGVIEV